MKEAPRVLSVDWDYFFPNVEDYDWGHRETGLFIDAIWPTRYYDRPVFASGGTDYAKDALVPRKEELAGFWMDCLGLGRGLDLIVVCESHARMYEALRAYQDYNGYSGPFEVVNFDAHHDLGYTDKGKTNQPGAEELECGNWAAVAMAEGLISRYDLVYPAWRQERPEANLKSVRKGITTLHYEVPKFGPSERFSAVFLCRSGAWTPPWQDEAWMGLFEGLKRRWRNGGRLMDDGRATKPRVFDAKAAEEYKRMVDEMMKKTKREED